MRDWWRHVARVRRLQQLSAGRFLMKNVGCVVGAVCLVLLALPSSSRAQEAAEPGLSVEGVQPLAPGAATFRQVEPFLAVNPKDPDDMIATAMADTDSLGGAVVYVSEDGGTRWWRVESPVGPLFPGGDPMVVFRGDGHALLSTLASGFSVWRSGDGGRSWQGPAEIEGNYDRQWLATPTWHGEEEQPVYAAAKLNAETDAIVAFRSRDGGRTFEELFRLPEDTTNLFVPTDLEIGANGNVLLPYLTHVGSAPAGNGLVRGERRILIASGNAGTWTGPHSVAEHLNYGNEAGDSLVFKNVSPGGLAVDASPGRFHGTSYIVWSQVVDGVVQVMMARSRNGGRRWSEPVRVNAGGRESHHSTPHVAVNRHGVVAVTWNDRRHDPGNQCYHHYIAISRDGGASFTSEQRISDEETCFPRDYRWQNGGDTQGLVALPSGNFRVVWTGPGPNGSRPWTALVRID